MSEPQELPELSNLEKEVYSWQTTVEGFGEKGQRKLKNASVMISRIGGLGGLVAYELAAAGVGIAVGNVDAPHIETGLAHRIAGRGRQSALTSFLMEAHMNMKRSPHMSCHRKQAVAPSTRAYPNK